MKRDDLNWESEDAWSYPVREGRSLRYLRNWQWLDARLSHYRIERSVGSQEIVEVFHSTLQEGDNTARYLEQVRPTENYTFTRMVGWATFDFDNPREILSTPVKGAPLGTREIDCEHAARNFRAAKIIIRTSSEHSVGSTFVWDHERDPGDPEGPFLMIDVRVPVERMELIIEDLRRQDRMPVLQLGLRILAFQDEVEARLAENFHLQTFAFLHDSSAPTILSNITYPLLREHAASIDDLSSPLPDRAALAPEPKSDRSIRNALWLLAAVILLAALIA